jgi:hypothetical protein
MFDHLLSLLALLVTFAPLALVGAVIDATRWSDKLLARVQNSGPDWEAGVAAPRRSPVTAMKAANGKWKANVQKAVAEDRWNKAIGGLTDAAIAAAAKAAGGARFVSGVTSRADKIHAAIAKLQPKVSALSARIQALPQDNDQQRETRMLENLRGMRLIKSS